MSNVVHILEEMYDLLAEDDFSSRDDFGAVPLWMRRRIDQLKRDQEEFEARLRREEERKAKRKPRSTHHPYDPPEYEPASDEYLAAQARYIDSKKHRNPPVGWKPHMDKGSSQGWSAGVGSEPWGASASLPKFGTKGYRLYYDD